VPAEKNESLSALVWKHATEGDPTVSLGTDRADDAARIVRAILAHLPEGLAFSDLATDCGASAWAIAVGAVKHAVGETNPSLVNRVKGLARAAAKVRRSAPDSLSRRMLGTVARTSRIVSRNRFAAYTGPEIGETSADAPEHGETPAPLNMADVRRLRQAAAIRAMFRVVRARSDSARKAKILANDREAFCRLIAPIEACAEHTAGPGLLSGNPSEWAS